MKKYQAVLLGILCVISLLSISCKNNVPTNNKINAANRDSIYLSLGMKLLENEKIGQMKIDAVAKTILSSLGKADSTNSPIVWETDGLTHQDYYFTQKGIELNISNEKDKEPVVYRITISKPSTLKTSRNIGIGSTKQEVLTAYKEEIDLAAGDANTIIAGSVFAGMAFTIENEKVSGIFIGASAE